MFPPEKIKEDVVRLRLNQRLQSSPQACILHLRQIALKDTKLHPLAIGLENLVNPRPTLVLGNIVANHHVHGLSTSPLTQHQRRIGLNLPHQELRQ